MTRLLLLLAAAASPAAQSGENVLLVVNQSDPASREIADYYRARRSIPPKNMCTIATAPNAEIQWAV